MWSSIKFSAFYIVSYVFVNMIFIHFYDFIRFQVLAVFLGPASPFWGFIDLQIFKTDTGSCESQTGH
jgi:hypothetical protein